MRVSGRDRADATDQAEPGHAAALEGQVADHDRRTQAVEDRGSRRPPWSPPRWSRRRHPPAPGDSPAGRSGDRRSRGPASGGGGVGSGRRWRSCARRRCCSRRPRSGGTGIVIRTIAPGPALSRAKCRRGPRRARASPTDRARCRVRSEIPVPSSRIVTRSRPSASRASASTRAARAVAHGVGRALLHAAEHREVHEVAIAAGQAVEPARRRRCRDGAGRSRAAAGRGRWRAAPARARAGAGGSGVPG